MLVDYEPLSPVPDADSAVLADSPVLHEALGDNLAGDYTIDLGDVDGAFTRAEVVTRERYDVQRYSGMPMETRGVAAAYDHGTGQLTVWSSTQWPHTIRDALAGALGLSEHRVRVVAPDVGGGFGIKQDVHPEELVLALLALRLRYPVRWIEARQEHVTAGVHAREQAHVVELAATHDGVLLGMRVDVLCDQGAYTRGLGLLCPSITALPSARAAAALSPTLIQQFRIVRNSGPSTRPYRCSASARMCCSVRASSAGVAVPVNQPSPRRATRSKGPVN